MKSRFIPFLFLLSLSLPLPVRAGGIPVFDAANLQQSAISAVEAVNQTLKQIEQYALQLQQYEDMIKNSIAPAAYVWDQAQRTMNKIIALQNQVEFYMSQIPICGSSATSPPIAAIPTSSPAEGRKRTERRSWRLKNSVPKLKRTPMTTS